MFEGIDHIWRWLNLKKFFHFRSNLRKKRCQITTLSIFSLCMWIVLRGGIWPGDLRQSYKLSAIKQPLIRIKEKNWKCWNILSKKDFILQTYCMKVLFLFLNRPLNKLLNVQNRQVFMQEKKVSSLPCPWPDPVYWIKWWLLMAWVKQKTGCQSAPTRLQLG